MTTARTSTGPTRDDSVESHFGMGNWPAMQQPACPSESDVDLTQALAFREDQIQRLEQQKHETEQKIRGLETGRWQRIPDCGQL